MTLSAFQWQYGGVVMGDGTPYEVIKAHGIDDLPTVRTQDIARGRDHGMWRGTDFAEGRTVGLDIEVAGADDTTFRANVEALTAATVVPALGLSNPESPLIFMLPGQSGNRQIKVRPRRRLVAHDLDYKFHKAKVSLEFVATDPRIYDAVGSSASIPVAASTTGFAFNVSFNLSFGTGGSGGSVQLVNAGNFPTRPLITIYGPVDNPTIQNVTAGKSLSFSVSLASTDYLAIDTDARTVLLNGTASRRSTLTATSQWWELVPGTNTVLYTAATVQVGSTAVVSWNSAWL